jgi:hypothetical protein
MISVILNVYKRPYTLETQIAAIKNQSIPIKSEDIHIWYNDVEGLDQPSPIDKSIKTYRCSWNTKFFGRFTVPLMCRTPFIAMFDDDVVPGRDWLKNCMETIKTHNGILGSSGIVVHGKSYRPNTVVGWNGLHGRTPARVDLVGHGWFFRKEWAKFMWLEEPVSWDNGEDMFFSYMAQKNGITTFVPPHPEDNQEVWGNVPSLDNDWGLDRNAHSHASANHIPLRNKIVSTLIDKGWNTIKKTR